MCPLSEASSGILQEYRGVLQVRQRLRCSLKERGVLLRVRGPGLHGKELGCTVPLPPSTSVADGTGEPLKARKAVIGRSKSASYRDQGGKHVLSAINARATPARAPPAPARPLPHPRSPAGPAASALLDACVLLGSGRLPARSALLRPCSAPLLGGRATWMCRSLSLLGTVSVSAGRAMHVLARSPSTHLELLSHLP